MDERWIEVLSQNLGKGDQDLVFQYIEALFAENKRQNLTRILTAEDFEIRNLSDVRAFWDSGVISRFRPEKILDLGSGGGLPSMILAIQLRDQLIQWILCDSEKKKAQFLDSVIQELSLERAHAYAGRGEDYLESHSVDLILLRGVGPLSRVYKWIAKRSTWNSLLLFKGRGWEAEWEEFKARFPKANLRIELKHEYSVKGLEYPRVLLGLTRE